jgi:hypothetical protein
VELSISHDNILQVDGRFLQARDTTPEDLYEILVEARWLIEHAIEEMYQELATDPELTVRRGSVWVMRLAKDESQVITPLGLLLDSVSQEDRGVFTRWLDVKRAWKPYWLAVYEAGLRPEGRTAHKSRKMNGFCLLAYTNNSR